jgi:hypothetical protein
LLTVLFSFVGSGHPEPPRANKTGALKRTVTIGERPTRDISESEVHKITLWLRNELRAELQRTSPERVQRQMTIFEMSVYAPTIEEAWKHSGIGRLKIEGRPNDKWKDVLESIVYTAGKYTS